MAHAVGRRVAPEHAHADQIEQFDGAAELVSGEPFRETSHGQVAAVRHEQGFVARPHRVEQLPHEQAMVPVVICRGKMLIVGEAFASVWPGERSVERR